jgi:parallel beta-helix repeat protein
MKSLIELFIIILLASAQSSGLDDSKAYGFAHTESSKQINNLYETPLEEHNHSEPTLALNAQTNQSNESKIVVHSGESIQAAINAATPGDIIEITNGTYKENILIKKQLIIRGVDNGGGFPIIDANGRGNVIEISSDQVVLENIAATNSSNSSMSRGAGIRISSSNNCSIKRNKLYKNCFGVNLYESQNNTISESNISDSQYGVQFYYSNNNTLERNYIMITTTPLEIVISEDNLIHDNIFRNNSNKYEIKGKNNFENNNETFIGYNEGTKPDCTPRGGSNSIKDHKTDDKNKKETNRNSGN